MSSLTSPAPAKPQAPLPQAYPAPLPDHQMVEHIYAEELAGVHDLTGDGDIFRGGRGVARGVVVGDDDRGGVLFERFLEDLAHAHGRGVDRADVDGVMAQDVVLCGERYDLEVLLLEVAHLQQEQVGDVGGGGDLRALFGRGEQEPAADFERGLDLGGFGFAHTVDVAEFFKGQPLQAGPAAVLDQHLLGELHHVESLNADAQQNGHEFGV